LAPYRRLNDIELQKLSDEELVAYLRRSRELGETEAALDALRILVYGFEGRIRSFVRGKVPSHAVDDIVDAILDSGFTSVFDEESIISFRAWIFRIARYRVADHYRKDRPHLDPLPEEHDENDEIFGELQSEADATEFVGLKDALERCLEELESDAHRRVVELAIFAQLRAREICELVNEEFPDLDPPMSESNVDKIKSRFRKCLRERLESDD
jgi:RNA polymerase sigma factor (sigma-70 family)